MAKVEVYTYFSRIWVLSLLVIIPVALSAQYTLHIKPVDKDSAFISSTLKLQTNFKSQQLCMDYVNTKIPGLMHNKGFISASVDSVHYDSLAAELYLYVGQAFRWAQLNTDSVDKEILNGVNWNKKEFEDKPVRVEQLQSIQLRFLDHLENHGYPFAKIELDSVSIDEGVLQARVKIDKGPLYKIDSIRNNGKANISNRYLQRYLNILNGSVYKKSSLQAISRKLQELPFVEEKQPWSITWLGTGSIINLELEPQRSSQVNILIGVLPATDASNNIYDAPRTKLQFTGEATINLRNALGNGEMIGLNWQQIQVKSPRLNLAYQQSTCLVHPMVSILHSTFSRKTLHL
jgi:outer membrane protein assembly factor BamA